MVRIAAACAALVLLAGCGEDAATPEDDVRATLAGYAKAFAGRDYQALCDTYFDPRLVSGLEQAGLPCESALRPEVGSLREPKLEVRKVTVDGDNATAEVHTSAANQSPADVTLALRRTEGQWRIVSTVTVGPEPSGL
jgi:ketosteroid isomerase-like protein